jgi:DnaJ-class molecular chaperone
MKTICEFCNGTGQISYFKGVSRFLLSSEDCPECVGLGFIVSNENEETDKNVKKFKNTKHKKTN